MELSRLKARLEESAIPFGFLFALGIVLWLSYMLYIASMQAQPDHAARMTWCAAQNGTVIPYDSEVYCQLANDTVVEVPPASEIDVGAGGDGA